VAGAVAGVEGGGSGSASGGSGGASSPAAAARSRARPWSTTAQALAGLAGSRQGPLPSATTPTPVSMHP
jgi:hypothetical protein